MRISISYYYPLLFIIPVVGVMLFTYKKYLTHSKRQKLLLTLRGISFLLIILSLCSIHIIKSAKDTATIFVTDLSNSTMDSREEAKDFIHDAIRTKSESDLVGIVSFGAESSTESIPSKGILFNNFQSKVNGEFTNIQSGLVHGTALFPANVKKRLVLLTDGNENIGDARRQLQSISQNNTAIDVYPLTTGGFPEVQLDQVDIPKKAEKNQTIDIVTHINSTINTSATLFLYSEDQLEAQEVISLEKGNNKYVFTDTINEGGLVTYRVEVVPESDTYVENNHLSSFTIVNDLPNILVVQDEEEEAINLIEMLSQSAKIDIKHPLEVPSEQEILIQYDAFILTDVSIEQLSEAFLKGLESVVKHGGKGLLVTGGDSSYGPGGYYKTPLEEVLPVNMDAKSKMNKPNLGLVLVIDKSGSMATGEYGVRKLDLAKEAAIRSTEILDEKDKLGVIAFDDSVKWVLKPTYVKDKEKMQKRIATIVPGGGTTIQPSLKEAVDTLKNQDVMLKHIILLTDGQAENSGYESIIKDMQEHQITLSTVAVGSGSDRKLLRNLANAGGGRYYATDVFTDIPSIFTKETFMAGKKYLNHTTFTPAFAAHSPIIESVKGLPELQGYVATTIKDKAKAILVGPDEDPILASWQYGLGRSVAFTSDMKGMWSSQWLNWSGNQGFWINTLGWLVQQDINKDYFIESSYEEGKGIVEVTSIGKEENNVDSISGTLITPEGKEVPIVLDAIAPGRYSGDFDPEGEGVYLANITIENDGEVNQLISGVNVGYSPEYDFRKESSLSPNVIIGITGGRIINTPKEVFKGNVTPVKGSRDISQILLIVGLLIFMLEIVIRKTNLNLEFINQVSKNVDDGRHFVLQHIFVKKSSKRELNSRDMNALKEKKALNPNQTARMIDKVKNKEEKNKKEQSTFDTSSIDTLLKQKRKRNK